MTSRPEIAVLQAAARLQELVPDAILVGGTAAALHARHRVSLDDDHVVADLCERFDDVLTALEDTDGWVTARIKRPVLILGRLDGVETGVRNLIRQRPLEVEEVAIGRRNIRVPTLREITRIKAWLCLMRNATRDYLDFVALADRLGEDEAAAVVLELDDYYADQIGPGGRRIATQVQTARGTAPGRPVGRGSRILPQAHQALAGLGRGAGCLRSSGRAGPRSSRQGGRTMIHRHLRVPPDVAADALPAAALVDILERGDLDDWQPIAAAVARDPGSALADRVMRLVDAYPSYGTSPLWRAWIDRARARPEPARLRALRQRAGLTQAELASRLSMSQSDLSKLERRADVRVSTLRAYAAALGGRVQVVVEMGGATWEVRLDSP